MSDSKVPKAISKWYSMLGKRGVAGRLATLTAEQKTAIARAGGLASQAAQKAKREARQSGTTTAD